MPGNVRIPWKTIDTLKVIDEPEEYKAAALKIIGNQIPTLMLNQILLGVYIYPERINGGPIIRPNVEEDIWQGKMGHVIAKGPAVFEDDSVTYFWKQKIFEGEWLLASINNCKQMYINNLPCRIVEDRYIVARFEDPRAVW